MTTDECRFDVVDALAGLAEDMRDHGRYVERIHDTVKAQRDELDRLHILVHRIHALTTEETAWETFPGMSAKYLREIHQLTTELIEKP